MSQNNDTDNSCVDSKIIKELIEVIYLALKYMHIPADQWTEEEKVKEYIEIKERIYKTLDKSRKLDARLQNTHIQTGAK